VTQAARSNGMRIRHNRVKQETKLDGSGVRHQCVRENGTMIRDVARGRHRSRTARAFEIMVGSQGEDVGCRRCGGRSSSQARDDYHEVASKRLGRVRVSVARRPRSLQMREATTQPIWRHNSAHGLTHNHDHDQKHSRLPRRRRDWKMSATVTLCNGAVFGAKLRRV